MAKATTAIPGATSAPVVETTSPIHFDDVRAAITSASAKMCQFNALFDVLRRASHPGEPEHHLAQLGWEEAENVAGYLDDVVRQIDAQGVNHG